MCDAVRLKSREKGGRLPLFGSKGAARCHARGPHEFLPIVFTSLPGRRTSANAAKGLDLNTMTPDELQRFRHTSPPLLSPPPPAQTARLADSHFRDPAGNELRRRKNA